MFKALSPALAALLLAGCSPVVYHLPGHSRGVESVVSLTVGEEWLALTTPKSDKSRSLASENPEVVVVDVRESQPNRREFWLVAKSTGTAGLHYGRFAQQQEDLKISDSALRQQALRQSSEGAFMAVAGPR